VGYRLEEGRLVGALTHDDTGADIAGILVRVTGADLVQRLFQTMT
jgi:hypothetical protein